MSSTNFGNCLAAVLLEEGGKSDDKRDPGGRTNKGITQRTYDAWRTQRGELLQDVYHISDAEVAAIYDQEYWTRCSGPTLPDGVDLSVFDFAVNSGVSRAVQAYHSAAFLYGKPDELIHEIASERLSFMKRLKTWSVFGKGWSARVARIEAKAMRMWAGHG